jgi:hypothetical protein
MNKSITAPNLVLDENGELIEETSKSPAKISADELLNYKLIRTATGTRWVPLEDAPGARRYSHALGEQIIEGLMSGTAIGTILKQLGVTVMQYASWRKSYDTFREGIDEARRMRAELMFDEMEKVVRETGADEDEISLARLKVDTFKHMAAVQNPRFGVKQQIDARVGVTTLVVETGIERGSGGSGDHLREVTEAQVKIAASEVADGSTIAIQKPIGMQATEKEKDGTGG